MQDTKATIRELNDRFRANASGASGPKLITSGVQSLVERHPGHGVHEVVEQVREFNGFDDDNDPHDEHDFGAFDFLGEKIFWKIDYYAPDLEHGSEDPADPDRTIRVMTIMLAAEY